MVKFEGGKWVRYGSSVPGPQPQGIYEDRVAMMLDDGGVPEFARYGAYITIGDRMRFFTNEAKASDVKAHAYLGQKRNQVEVRKYLPATRKTSATGARSSRRRNWRPCARGDTSLTCGIGGPIAPTPSTLPTMSTYSTSERATPAKGPSLTTGTPRRSSQGSCWIRKRPTAER